MELMLTLLQNEKEKVPKPSRENMVRMLITAWDKLTIDYESAFKSLFITNALDGSEDFLVSDRLMRLVGDSVRKYRESLLKSKVPSSIQEVIRNLIPPKGIRRKTTEGYELLDYVEHDDNDEEDVEDTDGSESDEDEGHSNTDIVNVPAPDSDVLPEISNDNAPNNLQTFQKSNSLMPLANLAEDENIKKDAVFLDKLSILLEENETSEQFLPFMKRMKNVNNEARRNVRKRIQRSLLNAENESQVDDVQVDDVDTVVDDVPVVDEICSMLRVKLLPPLDQAESLRHGRREFTIGEIVYL